MILNRVAVDREQCEKVILNRVAVDQFSETLQKARNDPSKTKKVIEFEGNWEIGKTGPQFSTTIKTEKGGEFLIQSDEPIALGGSGTAPNPVQYGLYGIASCFAASLAKWTAMEGIVLNQLKIKVRADMDLSASFGIFQEPAIPIYERIKFEIVIDSGMSMEEIERFNEIAKQRCPCYYCLTAAIIPEIVFKKGDQNHEQVSFL
ncbi:OsmC family protein [Methanosarcina siciliae]|uniref:OsmC family protein n=1 Tax=Methanosarcina siciliae TaxID=38027 RepID=UPI000B319707|nr:OsmC family protein [Methanosarcina siciliae]